MQGWIFGALLDEESRYFYWLLSILYALPYITEGFSLDGFEIFCLLFGVAHMQIERIAATEPVELRPGAMQQVLGKAPKSVKELGNFSEQTSREIRYKISENRNAGKRAVDRREREQENELIQEELFDFDRRLQRRKKNK